MKLKRDTTSNSISKQSILNLKALFNKISIDEYLYASGMSAYNPNSPYVDMVYEIPEDWIYPNKRHHLKKIILVDSRKDKNNNDVVIGYSCTSVLKNGNKSIICNGNDLIAVNKVLVTQTVFKRLIMVMKLQKTNIVIVENQRQVIKEISKLQTNIKKSLIFRQKNSGS